MGDARSEIQAALDANAGGSVELPVGRFVIDQGAGYFGLTIPAGTTLHGAGAGTVLEMAPGIARSVRLLDIAGPGITLANLTLDGSAESQDDQDEHRAGVFCRAPELRIEHVTARRFTGDGFYFYAGSDGFQVKHCEAIRNGRNGLTIGAGMSGGTVESCVFTGNRAQQFDSEPGGPVNDIAIRCCVMDGAGASNDYVLTVTGGSPTALSSGWEIEDCDIRGGAHAVWARDIAFSRCRVTNSTTKPCVSVYRTCDGITIDDCKIISTGHAITAVDITGTSEGGADRVTIRRCRIDGAPAGVMASGAVGVELYDNDIRADSFGIYARATVPEREFKNVIIRGNRVRAPLGIQLAGNGAAVLRLVDIAWNVFDAVTGAMSLDEGSGAAWDVRQCGNVLLGGQRMIVSPPTGTYEAWWGNGGRWLRQ